MTDKSKVPSTDPLARANGGGLVLARPQGLKKCRGCGYHFAPSYAKVVECPVCRENAIESLPERKCAYDGCEMVFKPQSSAALYHSASCRQMAYEKRKRQEAA